MSDRAGRRGRRPWRDRVASFLDRCASLFARSDFSIHYRPGRLVVVRGRIPRGKVPAISGFFSRDLSPGRSVTVRGRWTGGALRLQFSGSLAPSARQRIRNFLIEHLR